MPIFLCFERVSDQVLPRCLAVDFSGVVARCLVHVQIAHDVEARDQLGDRAVFHHDVQPVLGEGIFPHQVGVFHTREGRNAGLELGLEVGVVKLAADLKFLELGSEGGSVDEEPLLVQSCAQGPERYFGVGAAALVLLEQVEERPGPEEVPLEALVQGVAQSPDQPPHVLDFEEVEPEGVLPGRLVQVAAAEAVPERDVRADLRGHELRQPAHAGHGLRGREPEHQVLSEVGRDTRSRSVLS